MLVAHYDVKQEEENPGGDLYQWVHVLCSSLTFRPENFFFTRTIRDKFYFFSQGLPFQIIKTKGADLKPYVPGIWWLAKISTIDELSIQCFARNNKKNLSKCSDCVSVLTTTFTHSGIWPGCWCLQIQNLFHLPSFLSVLF